MSDILIIPNRGSTSAPEIQFSGSANSSASIKLQVLPEGQVAFMGKSGSLFSIVDSMQGSLMAVSDISGLPILEVFSDDRVVMGKFNKPAVTVTGSQVRMSSSGSNYAGYSLVVDSNNGNVGYIGVISPSEAGITLDTKIIDTVYGSRLDVASGGGVAKLDFYKGSGYGGGENFIIYYTAGATAAADTLQFQSGNSTAMTINGSQNVAIGKTTPINGKLDINGTFVVTGSVKLPNVYSGTNAGAANVYVGTDGTLYRSTTGASSGSSGTSGAAGATGSSGTSGSSGSSGAGTISGGSANYHAKFSGATTLTTGLVYDNGSGIAINKTAPINATLDVNGDTNLTGSLYATQNVVAGLAYVNSFGVGRVNGNLALNGGNSGGNPGTNEITLENNGNIILKIGTSNTNSGKIVADLSNKGGSFVVSGSLAVSGSLIVTGDVQADFTPMFMLMGA